MSIYSTHIKRLVDILLSLVLMIAFSWLFILILLLYIITFQFPIFFIQLRIGKDQKPFPLIKFRTLSTNMEAELQHRRFWLGDVLRYLSLDELPQLWNVLKGEMSLVGPRPLPMEYLPLMNEQQKTRHTISPGITGWTQVNGRHGITWQEKFKLDLEYVNNLSFWLDVKILLRTMWLMIHPAKDQSLNEKKFEGSA